jgi:hypothetical protein
VPQELVNQLRVTQEQMYRELTHPLWESQEQAHQPWVSQEQMPQHQVPQELTHQL